MVVISNGFNKFHLAIAAAEVHAAGSLTRFYTGAYPTPGVRRFLDTTGLSETVKFRRLLARRENLPDEKVRALFAAEAVHVLRTVLRPLPIAERFNDSMDRFSMHWYGNLVGARLASTSINGARVYHYRAGFGHASVAVAKRLGMVTICDHSIVHPSLLAPLVETRGRLNGHAMHARPNGLWGNILSDIEQADAVLVNSDFVKKTFRDAGWKGSELHVVYLGVDDQFLAAVPERTTPLRTSNTTNFLFAGAFERRKGAEILIAALQTLSPTAWHLDIAGSIDPEIAVRHRHFLSSARVTKHGTLPRDELARRMAACDAFVFPSLAEGSARVVFEALAAGCFVITTENSGSIVEDGVHGRIVPPGDEVALASCLSYVANHREQCARIGLANRKLVRERYTQKHYGAALIKLYDTVLSSTARRA